MSTRIGTIGWLDLTVDNAEETRAFYEEVAGWTPEAVPMPGGYSDWAMGPEGSPVAGVCHARGENAGMPTGWLPYITVSDLEVAVAASVRLGGDTVVANRRVGEGRMAIVRDPSGATVALYSESEAD